MKIFLILMGILCGIIGIVVGMIMLVHGQVNVTELDTLDRMWFTAIQMTILDLESQTPTNMSNDQIATEIYKYQNNSNDRLTTLEIENLYRNITNGTQLGPEPW